MRMVSTLAFFMMFFTGCASTQSHPDFFWVVTEPCGTERMKLIKLDTKARERIEQLYVSSDAVKDLTISNAKYTKIDDNNHIQITYRSESDPKTIYVIFDIHGNIGTVR